MKTKFLFLSKEEILEAQRKVIEDFGGSHGLRDEGALESALKAAENRQYYENADLPTCAAIYAFNLTQAHASVDGNKRIADVAAMHFLKFNGTELTAPPDQVIELFLKIAAGEMTREETEQFFAAKVKIKS